MANVTTHEKQIVSLKRIEGQVRGIQRMIKEKRYCIDIITQLHSVTGAIDRVTDNILKKHLDGCVSKALKEKNSIAVHEKIDEILDIVKRLRRTK